MNLTFTLDRLEKLNLLSPPAAGLAWLPRRDGGWTASLIAEVGEIWAAMPSLAGHADDVPEIAGLLLTHFIERARCPVRRFWPAVP